MEDSFRVRVDKVFGSLATSTLDTSSSMSYLWCLTDKEIERREWNRDRGSTDDDLEPKPYPSNLDGFFANQRMVSSQIEPSDFRKELESDLQELHHDDEFDEKQRRGSSSRQYVKADVQDDEEWDIRSSIGLDCTLDYEEEEDAYDKVATGSEKADDLLYIRGITHYKDDINSYEFPKTIRDVNRDSRANHMAAKVRLKEDAESAGIFDSLLLSYNTAPPGVDTQNNTLEYGVNLKSMLKRDNQLDCNSEKRVRFDPGCRDYCEEEFERTENLPTETSSVEEALASEAAYNFLSQDSSGVPNYMKNPLKYTHYTFDSSSDIDEESNGKTYMDFLNSLRGQNTVESQDDFSIDLPQSVAFTPTKNKKQPGDASMKNGNRFKKQNQEDDVYKEYMHKKGFPIGIAAAAGDAQENEVCSMEEDEPETEANNKCGSGRPGRQYRKKASVDLDDLVT